MGDDFWWKREKKRIPRRASIGGSVKVCRRNLYGAREGAKCRVSEHPFPPIHSWFGSEALPGLHEEREPKDHGNCQVQRESRYA